MRIPIPAWYDKAMDAIATWLLPPPKPIGLRLFGNDIVWTDVALVAYPTAAALGLWWWSGNWLWLPAVAGTMALALVIWGWGYFK